MKKVCLLLLVCMVSMLAFSQDNSQISPNAPPMLGIQWAKGTAMDNIPARRSPNMTYHGGKIMTTAVTGAIFWGTSWGTYQGDKIRRNRQLVHRLQQFQLCQDQRRVHRLQWASRTHDQLHRPLR